MGLLQAHCGYPQRQHKTQRNPSYMYIIQQYNEQHYNYSNYRTRTVVLTINTVMYCYVL